MKKDFLMSVIVAIVLVFGVKTCYDKKVDNNTQVSTEKEVVNENDMIVNGYALGEIPSIPIPEIPNFSVTESPETKAILDITKKIASIPGIIITPVKVENENIVGGAYSTQDGKDEEGQYEDDKVTIQRSKDGSGQYLNKVTGETLQVDANGLAKYLDDKNGISMEVNSDGTGFYKDLKNNIIYTIDKIKAIYEKGNVVTENNGDGSGSYNDKEKNLLIKNDGKGKAIITFNGKTTEVEAKPLEKFEKFPQLKMISPAPSIEANSVLITLDSGILFDVNKYDVRPEAAEVLKNLASVLKEANIKAFEIQGHTDSDASDEHNQVLSENRANSVKNFLASQGITAEISIKGYGERKPISSNDTEEGKQKNRRVEIIVPAIK